MTRGSVRTIAIACGLVLLMAACGEELGPGQGSTSTASPTSMSPSSATPIASGDRWIAVIDVASEPSDLDALTQRLRGPLGRALVVSPTDCFEGLPDRAGEGYLIGAAGESRAGVERLVTDAGEKVAFSAKVTIVCMD
jgi:hypothetical protein